VKQAVADRVEEDHDLGQREDASDRGPGWATVLVVVALLCFAALPRSIVLTGLSPIIIVVSAMVVVLWRFGKE
jgi:hypothetical protein